VLTERLSPAISTTPTSVTTNLFRTAREPHDGICGSRDGLKFDRHKRWVVCGNAVAIWHAIGNTYRVIKCPIVEERRDGSQGADALFEVCRGHR
jgi:hypothetical protein